MAEIAQHLRIAPSTVSRALRDDPRIGQGTRARIRAAAADLGYRPNPLVSALMASRRRRGGAGEIDVIALVTSYGGREDWRSKQVCRWEFEGIQARAAALGFRIEVFSMHDYQDDAARLESTLRARGIRGVLLGFSRGNNEPVPFSSEGFAIAGLSAYFKAAQVDRANFHGFYNVRIALDHIWRLGYRRPALVVPELNNSISNNSWSAAFLDWQRRIPARNRCLPFIPAGNPDLDEFSTWLCANEPDSILFYKVPVRSFLSRAGRRVPEEIGVACLYRTADEMRAMGGIDGNLSAVGAAALDLVVERLNANNFGPTEHPKEVLIKGTWYEGATLPPRLPASRGKPATPPRASARASGSR
jgi:LacI family transcriptional regulator/LacI family fructose operon transcriptional repressor